jgi:hypothetical protein
MERRNPRAKKYWVDIEPDFVDQVRFKEGPSQLTTAHDGRPFVAPQQPIDGIVRTCQIVIEAACSAEGYLAHGMSSSRLPMIVVVGNVTNEPRASAT